MKKTFTTAFTRTEKSIKDVSCVKFTSPSKVKKSLAYATDINTIYDNYCKTGHLPLNGAQPLYDENFVNYDNLIDAQKTVSEATLYFQSLPAKIKNQYGNSLEKFILALNNKDEFLVKEGVLNLPTPEPTSKTVVSEPVSESVTSVNDKLNIKKESETPVNTATTV